jgi:beta-lactamase class A
VGADYWQSVKEGRAGVVVVDVTDMRSPKVAGFNPDQMMYAASLPKIAIALGAFVQIERGAMTLNDDTRVSLTRRD